MKRKAYSRVGTKPRELVAEQRWAHPARRGGHAFRVTSGFGLPNNGQEGGFNKDAEPKPAFSDEDWRSALGAFKTVSDPVHERPALTLFFKRVEMSALSVLHGFPAEGVWLFGAAGMGKSTALAEASRRVERSCGRLRRATLILPLLPSPTKHSITVTLLRALGYSFPVSGSFAKLFPILIGALRSQKIRVLFIDEAQHICEGNRDVLARDIVDFLKRLIDEANVCLVLSGIETTRKLKDSDAQLASRMPGEVTLDIDFKRSEGRAFASRVLEGSGIPFTPDAQQFLLRFMVSRADANVRLFIKIVRESVKVAALTRSASVGEEQIRHAIGWVLLKASD